MKAFDPPPEIIYCYFLQPQTMYQFLTSSIMKSKQSIKTLSDSEGNETAHIIGLFYRTTKCLQHQILPVWVFDGKAPETKDQELERRTQARDQARVIMDKKVQDLDRANKLKEQSIDIARTPQEQKAHTEMINTAIKYAKRTKRFSEQNQKDAINLLELMGIPYVISPGQAEAQCSFLGNNQYVDGVVSEDMDVLAFGSKSLIRNLNFQDQDISQIILSDVLSESGLSYRQFLDFCILCGCDYSSTIENIGPITAYQFIQKYKSIEGIINNMEEIKKSSKQFNKMTIDAGEFTFEQARNQFLNPKVSKQGDFSFSRKPVQEDKILDFLVKEQNFTEQRVLQNLERIKNI